MPAEARVVFLTKEKGEVLCTSKYPKRCSRTADTLWPTVVKCVLTTYQGVKSLDRCAPLGLSLIHI